MIHTLVWKDQPNVINLGNATLLIRLVKREALYIL